MEERIESQPVYNGKLFQVYKDRVRLPNGNATTREIVRHPGSVAIVPRHKDGRVVLVRQYRYVTGRELWEIPAGTLDKPGEGIAEGARRELAEEARLEAGRWTTLGSAYLMPGYCDERMTFYLAEDLSPTEGHAELDESFSVNPFDVHDLQVLRSSGELQDAKTLLGLAWAGIPLWGNRSTGANGVARLCFLLAAFRLLVRRDHGLRGMRRDLFVVRKPHCVAASSLRDRAQVNRKPVH